jgi:polar amino acid transport system substrate-binding protein
MKRIVFSLMLVATLLLAACGGQAATQAPAQPAATQAPAQLGTTQAPAQPAADNAHLDKVKAAGVIKVGTSADYPPFESVDSNGNKVGFDIDLMTEIAKRMGVKLEWVDMPFDSLIAAVQEGKIDAAISAFNYTPERDEKIDFTDAYFTSEDAFLVSDKFTGQINAPEDVAKYMVGVQTGTTQDSWLTDNLVKTGKLPEANLFRYDRVDQAVLDLKSGRIDVLMADYVPAQTVAKQQGGLKIVYNGTLSGGPVNIVIPNGDTGLAQAMNAIIKQLQTEGVIDQLAQKNLSGQ